MKRTDEDGLRCLTSREYIQMAGRAGRRGKDKVGHVILMMNFINVPLLKLRSMMTGKPQNIKSQFKLTTQYVIRRTQENKQNEMMRIFAPDHMKDYIMKDIEYMEKTLHDIGFFKNKNNMIIANNTMDYDALLGVMMFPLWNTFHNQEDIVGLLSLFLTTKCISDDMRVHDHNILDISPTLKNAITKVIQIHQTITNLGIMIPDLNFDMVEYMYKWARGDKYESLYFDGYKGTFIREVLRIDNMISSLESITQQIPNMNQLYVKLSKAHNMIFRNEVHNESLWIS